MARLHIELALNFLCVLLLFFGGIGDSTLCQTEKESLVKSSSASKQRSSAFVGLCVNVCLILHEILFRPCIQKKTFFLFFISEAIFPKTRDSPSRATFETPNIEFIEAFSNIFEFNLFEEPST